MSLDTVLSTLQLGLVYSVLGLGLFLSFRILNTPDLTVDGSFVTGMAISAVLTLARHPILGLAAAFAGGLGAGSVTGLFHTRLKIQPIVGGYSDDDGAVFRESEDHGRQAEPVVI